MAKKIKTLFEMIQEQEQEDLARQQELSQPPQSNSPSPMKIASKIARPAKVLIGAAVGLTVIPGLASVFLGAPVIGIAATGIFLVGGLVALAVKGIKKLVQKIKEKKQKRLAQQRQRAQLLTSLGIIKQSNALMTNKEKRTLTKQNKKILKKYKKYSLAWINNKILDPINGDPNSRTLCLTSNEEYNEQIPVPVKDKDGNIIKDANGNPVTKLEYVKCHRIYNPVTADQDIVKNGFSSITAEMKTAEKQLMEKAAAEIKAIEENKKLDELAKQTEISKISDRLNHDLAQLELRFDPKTYREQEIKAVELAAANKIKEIKKSKDKKFWQKHKLIKEQKKILKEQIQALNDKYDPSNQGYRLVPTADLENTIVPVPSTSSETMMHIANHNFTSAEVINKIDENDIINKATDGKIIPNFKNIMCDKEKLFRAQHPSQTVPADFQNETERLRLAKKREFIKQHPELAKELLEIATKEGKTNTVESLIEKKPIPKGSEEQDQQIAQAKVGTESKPKQKKKKTKKAKPKAEPAMIPPTPFDKQQGQMLLAQYILLGINLLTQSAGLDKSHPELFKNLTQASNQLQKMAGLSLATETKAKKEDAQIKKTKKGKTKGK